MKTSSTLFSIVSFLGIGFVVCFLGLSTGHARPEYALKHGIVNCTACHVSPAGGGVRNVYGKLYGSHGYKTNEHHERSYYQLDVRALAYTSQEVRQGRNGLGLMEVLGYVNIPVTEDEKSQTNFVAAYNYGAFEVGLRDTYLRWERKNSTLLKHIVVGVFVPPFGLLTDEHRTYARVLTRSTWNNFDMGAMFSGDLARNFHWDFAAVNGFQNAANEGGGTFSQGDTYGLYLNARYRPFDHPLFFGASGSYHRRYGEQESPYATSLYAGWALDELTGHYVSGSILLEYVRAQHWNDATINPEYQRQVASGLDTAFVDQLKGEVAEGYYLQLLYDLSRNFTLQYKWDRYTPSVEYSGDYFERYGLGFRYQTSANLQLWARGEWVKIGRPDVSRNAPVASDAYWLLAHYWF